MWRKKQSAGGKNDWSIYRPVGEDNGREPTYRKRHVNTTPKESSEQIAVCDWLDVQHSDVLYYAVPNAAIRGPREAAKLLAEGMKRGVPDICICEPRGGYHGMYVEMKRRDGGTVSADQREWLSNLTERNYRAIACRGYDEAVAEITAYLRESKESTN